MTNAHERYEIWARVFDIRKYFSIISVSRSNAGRRVDVQCGMKVHLAQNSPRPYNSRCCMQYQCPRGGIGRRAWFRSMCREVWGFESLRGHQKFRKKAAEKRLFCFPPSSGSGLSFGLSNQAFDLHQIISANFCSRIICAANTCSMTFPPRLLRNVKGARQLSK